MVFWAPINFSSHRVIKQLVPIVEPSVTFVVNMYSGSVKLSIASLWMLQLHPDCVRRRRPARCCVAGDHGTHGRDDANSLLSRSVDAEKAASDAGRSGWYW